MIEGNDLIALIACLFFGTIVSAVILGRSDSSGDGWWIYGATIGSIFFALWAFVLVGNAHRMCLAIIQLEYEDYSWRALQSEMLCVFAVVLAFAVYRLSLRISRSVHRRRPKGIAPMSVR